MNKNPISFDQTTKGSYPKESFRVQVFAGSDGFVFKITILKMRNLCSRWLFH